MLRKIINSKRLVVLFALVIVSSIILISLIALSHKEKVFTGKNTPAGSKASEDPLSPNYKWKGDKKDPKKIIIKKINVNAYVEKVGLDKNQEVGSPKSIYLAGWYKGSVRPGQKGLSVIDGHVAGKKNNGVFRNLEKLNVGDEYTVVFGDNSTKKFKITGKISVPVEDAVSAIFSQTPKIIEQLNLVTCDGKFNSKTQSYPQRLVIISTLKQ